MIKRMKWIVLIVVLFWLTGCTHTSEAKVTVVNKGELYTYVYIYNTYAKIVVGQSNTFTFTWPGRDTIYLTMTSYPVGQSLRVEYEVFELNDGDNITLNVEFKKI